MKEKPSITKDASGSYDHVAIKHRYAGNHHLYFDSPDRTLFTENETNEQRIFGKSNDHPFKKDLFHEAITSADFTLATQKNQGTKFAPMYRLQLEAGQEHCIRLRLNKNELKDPLDSDFDALFKQRQDESSAFHADIIKTSDRAQHDIQKQAFAGLLWTKQYYNYEVEQWLKGDGSNIPPLERWHGRNAQWQTLRNHDILSMPDAWEYPWFAAWDTAFHCVAFSLIDLEFAKNQLLLFTKEWYMAPNGQIPAYEWNFSDVNPPVQAWATLQIYKKGYERTGKRDITFLKRMFNKLALNFTWWVNREDSRNNNVFEGGFLGLDNIGVFDRSNGIPEEGILEQIDGTSWMALFCLNMLEMALEIAIEDATFEDMAVKYFGHFVLIAESLNKISSDATSSWDSKEGFFYDTLILKNSEKFPIKVRSISGLLALTAVLNIRKECLDKLPRFKASMNWFHKYRLETGKYQVIEKFNTDEDILLSLVPKKRLTVLLKSMFDEDEFLSTYGIRSLSKVHETPYEIQIKNQRFSINYESAESSTYMFGGNSNWRGPIWMPMNYLFIDTLRKFHSYFEEELKFSFPTDAGNELNLMEIAVEISKRLITIFEKDQNGDRPLNALHSEIYRDDYFNQLILFYEYFDGDTGRGVGASHQTGWTALVANLIDEIN